MILDERVHAYRRDIADIALAGQLFAPNYARPLMRRCGPVPAFVRTAPCEEAPISSQLLPGEEFAALEMNGHWVWGYCRADHYVGYVEADSLVDDFQPSHIVVARHAPILAAPDDHAPSLAALPMGARIDGRADGDHLAAHGGYIPLTHVRALDVFEHDPVAVAERLVGAPYLLGGRTDQGIDCSGLVQIALGLCGIPAPRDSDQQHALGRTLAEDAALRRGDIVFFEGHVGLMVDRDRLIHATAHAGAVVVEPLSDVAARKAIVARRRLP